MQVQCPYCKEWHIITEKVEPYKEMNLKKALTIIEMCMTEFGVTEKLFYSKSRYKHVASARHCAMWLIYKYCGYSINIIGRILIRDHTTVLYGKTRIRDCFFTRGDLFYQILRLEAKCELMGSDTPIVNQLKQTA